MPWWDSSSSVWGKLETPPARLMHPRNQALPWMLARQDLVLRGSMLSASQAIILLLPCLGTTRMSQCPLRWHM